MSCAHAGDWIEGRGYICKLCDRAICTDCGSREVWWWSESGYCRRDEEKSGNRSYVESDPDKILAFFGGDQAKARAFIAETARDW